MASVSVDILVRNLVRLLNDQVARHGELASLMEAKLEAVKQADSDRIRELTAAEMALVERATEREGLRRQITARILDNLGLRDVDVRELRLSELATYLDEPLRSQILVAASGLKIKVKQVERRRLTNALVTEAMIVHLGEVLSVMTRGGVNPDVYLPSGRRPAAGPAEVFEAVG